MAGAPPARFFHEKMPAVPVMMFTAHTATAGPLLGVFEHAVALEVESKRSSKERISGMFPLAIDYRRRFGNAATPGDRRNWRPPELHGLVARLQLCNPLLLAVEGAAIPAAIGSNNAATMQ